MPPGGTDGARPENGGAADPFASDEQTRKRAQSAKSPYSGVPYYVVSSQNGMRDKLPRINVSPAFSEVLSRAVASDKVPQWSSQESALRFMLMVGAREVEKILDDPKVTKLVNQFSSLSLLETIEASRKASRDVLETATRIMSDPRATPYELEAAKIAVREAGEVTDDPQYKRQMEQLLERGW